MRSLSLRARLILGTVALVFIGLAVADVVTYSQLRSFLIKQTETSLQAAHVAVEGAFTRGSRGPPDGRGRDAGGSDSRPPAPDGPAADIGALTAAAPGMYVQLRRLNGQIVHSGSAPQFSGGTRLSRPQLPASITLPAAARNGEAVKYFTVKAQQGGGRYRVRASTEPNLPGYVLIVAGPLNAVDSTLHRLLLVELLVTALALAGVTALGLWVVRLSLRPLGAIQATAAAIASGDLSRRVDRADAKTEVGRLGGALNAMLGQIESAFKAREASERKLRRFVADASHELRTPLAAVRAYAELFARGAANRPDDLARSMTGISRESERMSLLVEDLLLLARLDEGRPLERKPVAMDEVVLEAIETAQTLDPGRPVELELVPATVIGDHDRLRQIIDNLLSNVRAHTPPKTRVRVALSQLNGTARVTVADHGPGLSSEQLEHVFERFYRTDASRTRASGGVGLGLSIVAAVVQAHGGSATVESTGQGASFHIDLPVAPPNGSQAPDDASS